MMLQIQIAQMKRWNVWWLPSSAKLPCDMVIKILCCCLQKFPWRLCENFIIWCMSNLNDKDQHGIKIHWVHMLFTSFVNVPEIGKSCHYLHSPRQPTWFIINAGNSQRWQRFSWPNKLTPIHPSDAEYLSICRVIMFMNDVLNHMWDFA